MTCIFAKDNKINMDLIINTFGTSLNRDNEGFVVKTKDGKKKVPLQHIRSIQLHKGTLITSDAVLLAIENEIEVLFVDKSGFPLARLWSPQYGSVSTIRKGQLVFTQTHDSIDWIKDIIICKIENQQALILSFNTSDTSNMVHKEIERLDKYIEKIKQLDGEQLRDIIPFLRGFEGSASKIYFKAMNNFIPITYRFEERSQHPATDITNALLNYGYGILYGKIEGALIEAGIDPYIGIMHSDSYRRPSLAFDVIEKYRVWIDYIVYSLLRQDFVTDDMYTVDSTGAVWIEGLAKRIRIQSINDYFEEVITIKGLSRSRNTHIQLFAQSIAQIFKKYNQ